MTGPPDDSAPPPNDDRPMFEGRVIHLLTTRLRVKLQTREDWDHDDKVDFMAEAVEDLPMPFRTEVQLTKQGGNLHKMEQFIRISERNPDALRVYIMPASWHRPLETAYAVRDILRYLRKTAKKPGVRCFFIEDGGKSREVNAYRRLDYLRRRCSPTNRRRRHGTIASADVHRQRFTVRTGDGKEFLALMGDAEGRLAASLKTRKNHPERNFSTPVGWRVTFVPHVEDRGPHTGRLRALSVIFPPRP